MISFRSIDVNGLCVRRAPVVRKFRINCRFSTAYSYIICSVKVGLIMAPNRYVLWHCVSYKSPCHDPSNCPMYRNNCSMYVLSQPSNTYIDVQTNKRTCSKFQDECMMCNCMEQRIVNAKLQQMVEITEVRSKYRKIKFAISNIRSKWWKIGVC